MDQNPQDHLDQLLNNQSDTNFQTTNEIYWNDQNEEIFLQDLFANTILNDSFNVEDNLSYSTSGSQNLLNNPQINNNIVPSLSDQINLLPMSQKNSDLVVFDSMTDFVLNLDTSFNLTDQLNYNQSVDQIEHVDFLLKESNTADEFKSIDVALESNQVTENPQDIFVLESSNDALLSNSINNATIPVHNDTAKNDDDLFKRPTTILSSFFHSLSNNNTQESLGCIRSSNKKSYQKSFKKNKLADSNQTELFSQFMKLNHNNNSNSADFSISSSPRLIKDQRNQLDSAIENDLSSSENNECNLVNISSSLSSSPSASATKAVKSFFSNTSSVTLKRSRKRSKLLNGTTTLTNNFNNCQTVNFDISQKLLVGNKPGKLNAGSKKINKKETNKEKKQTQKQQQQQLQHHSNFEPSSKKFAIDSSKKSLPTNTEPLTFQGLKFLNTSNPVNREEVDLHIKELSLLDLHSSEDDSNERLASSLKKNLRPLVNLTVKAPPKKIPIISISCSDTSNPNGNSTVSSETTVTGKESENLSATKDEGTVNNPECETNGQLSKLKQYWNKSSIDSDSGFSTKSSTDSLNIKKKLKQSKSTISLANNTHGEQSSMQNKRKKQNTSGQYTCTSDSQVYIDAESLVNPTVEVVVKSVSLDNDTLQHMKNLDLNQDLSNDSAKPSTSGTSVKPIKYIKAAVNTKKATTPVKKIDSLCDTSLSIDLSDKKSRETLWGLLKAHSSTTEMLDQFGSLLHDKISFWDLVQFKIKHSKNKNELNTIYEITDDYTKLYSNMSTLLEGFVKEHSQEGALSRSRSSSRNYRK